MTDIIKQIEDLNLRCDSSTLLPVILRVEQLIKERDEARREVCRLMSMFNAENSVEIAASRSWDCFKEDTK